MIIDPIQILLIFVIIILTVLLFIIGLGFFEILKEAKKTLEKINKILDDTGRITNSIVAPIEQASEFLVGLKKGINFLNSISNFFKNKNSRKKIEEVKEVLKNSEIEEKESHPSEKKETKQKKKSSPIKPSEDKKRFFKKKGKSFDI